LFVLLVTKTSPAALFEWEVILMIGKLNSAWWTLKVGLGLGAFLAGLDKFFNVLTNCECTGAPWPSVRCP
jgi:hypothetical protein